MTADCRPAAWARATRLRLEAAMRLYGNDIDETTTVLEADLGWIVGWNKGDFIGADALRRAEGRRRRRGSSSASRCSSAGIARQGYDVFIGGERPACVTSGTQTPFLKKAIGMAYLPVGADGCRAPSSTSTSAAGALRARVVPMPFYKRRT